MGLVVPFVPQSLHHSCTRQNASLRAQRETCFSPPLRLRRASLPRHVELCAEREQEDVSSARTYAARIASCSAKPSISPPSRQTFWPSQPSQHPLLCPSFATRCGRSISCFCRCRRKVAATRLPEVLGSVGLLDLLILNSFEF
jgi:hypothetical protein